jgi:hypothetical protein
VIVKVFAITVDGVEKYWTGRRGNGGLELTDKRADAMKFTAEAAHVVSETHPELQDSDVWRMQTVKDKCGKLVG